MGTSQDRIAGTGPGQALALAREIAALAGRGGIVTAVFVAASAILEGVGLALIVPLLGIVISPAAPSGRLEHAAAAAFTLLGVETQVGRLALLMGALGLVVALRAAVLAVRDMRVSRLQIGFAENLRLRLAERLAAASWPQLMRLRFARITQLMGEMQAVGAAANTLLRIVVGAVMVVVLSVLVTALAPALMLVVLALLAVLAVLMLPLVRRAYGLGADVMRGNIALMNSTTQFLGGLKLAIGQNLQPAFLAEFRRTIDQLSARQIAFVRRQAVTRAATTLLTTIAAGLLVLAGVGIFHATSATLIGIVVVIVRMTAPATQIYQDMQMLARLLPSFASMRELDSELATLPQAESTGSAAVAPPEGPVAFHAVTYRHSEGEGEAPDRGVSGLDLTIAPGECVGVSGPSGAGKTTFADLLAGLLTPQQGRIAVGATPLEGAALAAWRSHIAYVAQDAFLFHDTVRRNLAWMAPGASEAAMWQALEIAGAADLVRRMEEGLETVVGERGTLVSGGERQRLALARAVLRAPRFVILDEATSAIDAASERAILARLRALTPRPAIVLIAHRAESLALCDRVLTFADGRVTDAPAPR